MASNHKRQLYQQAWIAIIFLYMIASIVWWYIQLNNQAYEIYLQQIKSTQAVKDINAFAADLDKNEIKFLSEGITFLVFICFGWGALSWIVYRQHKATADQQHFLELLAHEIKTPITIAKVHMQNVCKQYKPQAVNQHKETQTAITQLNYLNMMVNRFLVFLRLEHNTRLSPLLEKIDMVEVVQNAYEKIKNIFSLYNHSFDINLPSEPVYVMGDEPLLNILLNNIIENACKHSQTKEPIYINLSNNKKWLYISIVDKGIGIEKSRIKTLFKKYQTQQHQTTSRSGIGLRISSLICKYHKGSISYEPQNNGSAFIIKLPIV